MALTSFGRGSAILLAALIALLGVFGAHKSAAQQRAVPGSRSDLLYSFSPIVKDVAPAVVNVYARRAPTRGTAISPFLDDPFFRRFFGGGGMPNTRAQSSLGSGVIVAPDGLIITNNHVIKGANEVRVALNDRREFDCEVLLRDERTDLAVLKVKGASGPLPHVTIGNSDLLEVGDIVLAIGNPFGVGQTVTQGIVSALARTEVGVTDYQFFIQTDAAINPGNSGGALIGMDGQLMGINTAIYSRSGGSNGIGFAIPSNMARIVATSARSGSVVRRPWVGAALQAVSRDIAVSLGREQAAGALVSSIMPESPADQAGLRAGDVILAVEGVEVVDPQTFNYRIATTGIGGEVTLDVYRGGRIEKTKLALTQAPETVPRDERRIGGLSPFQGALVANLSPAVAEEVRVEFDSRGVVIKDIAVGSAAERIGLSVGDIILDINGMTVSSTRQLEAITQDPLRVWQLAIDRGGRLMRMAFRG